MVSVGSGGRSWGIAVAFVVLVACEVFAASSARAGDIDCWSSVSRQLSRVSRQQSKAALRCLRAAQRGGSFGPCLAQAGDENALAAAAVLESIAANHCDPTPAEGFADPQTAARAPVDAQTALIDDLLGADPGAAVAAAAGDRTTRVCPQFALKSAGRVLAGVARDASRCVREFARYGVDNGFEFVLSCWDSAHRTGADGPLARVVSRIVARCGSVAAAALPGDCGPRADVPGCLRSTLMCRGCETIRDGSALPVDCPACDEGRVLVVGLDGADQRVVDTLRAAGLLPEMDTLLTDGAWGTVGCADAQPSLPCFCPPVWSSLATAQSAQTHGLNNLDSRTDERKVPALWTVLHRYGGDSSLFGYRNTYPPEAEPFAVVTEPGSDALAKEFFDTWGLPFDFEVTGSLFKPDDLPERTGLIPGVFGDPTVYISLARDRVSSAALDAVVTDASFPASDLTMIIWHSIDKLEHVLWAGIQPTLQSPLDTALVTSDGAAFSGPEEGASFVDYTIAGQYLEADRWLSTHLASGQYDYIVFVSDHGMDRGFEGELPGHHGPGHDVSHASVFGVSGPGVIAGATPGPGRNIMDAGATIAYLLGLPIPTDLEGAVMTELFTPQHLAARPVRSVYEW